MHILRGEILRRYRSRGDLSFHFSPTEILCPCTERYIRVDVCRLVRDRGGFQSFTRKFLVEKWSWAYKYMDYYSVFICEETLN